MSITGENIRNIAVIGHSGEGKTTLCEAMLYVAGATDRLGRVADGNTVLDFDAEEKRRALDMIMLKNTGRGGWEYSEKMLDAVCVFSLTVDELACKEHE